MHLRRLEVRDLRILRRVALEPSQGFNVIVGGNGSGKTSLLEAIYLLGSGRSFRTRPVREIITRGSDVLYVFGELLSDDRLTEVLGIEKGPLETRIRLCGEPVRAASLLARALPLVVVTPDTQRLLSDGAELRRRLVDWALFHVEPGYHGVLQQYRRAVRQRNVALREGWSDARLKPWTREAAALGTRLHASRGAYLKEVLQDLGRTVETLLGVRVDITYEPGWDEREALAEVLAASLGQDRAQGFTGAGPHRADLRFTLEGSPAQHVLSRGEGKLFVAAVMLGQVRYLARRSGKTPVALVDDFASELDEASRARFLAALGETGAQVFVTALTPEAVIPPGGADGALFHVERGAVTQMV